MKPTDLREIRRPETTPADARTLVLSVPRLSVELLERFLAYQRALVEARKSGPQALNPADAPQLEVRAHQAALEDCGLSIQEVEQLSAVARDVAGRWWTYSQLAKRQDELKAEVDAARKRGEPAPARAAEKLDRLAEELRKVDPTALLERRYGRENVDILRTRQDELVALHRQVHSAQ
jgi:hypothetical protein